MRNRILRLLVLGAVTSVATATAGGQQFPFPSSLASAPAYAVPDRLLEHRTELALTGAQVAELTAASTDLHTQERFQAMSSKPWVTAARRTSPRQAFDRALATLTPKQREPAVRVLTSRRESDR
jgi:hypothetical protein